MKQLVFQIDFRWFVQIGVFVQTAGEFIVHYIGCVVSDDWKGDGERHLGEGLFRVAELDHFDRLFQSSVANRLVDVLCNQHHQNREQYPS